MTWGAGPTRRIPRHHVHPKIKSWAVALNVSILSRRTKKVHDAPWPTQLSPSLFNSKNVSDSVVATLIFTMNDYLKEMLFVSGMAYYLRLKLVVILHNVVFSNRMNIPSFNQLILLLMFCAHDFVLALCIKNNKGKISDFTNLTT